MALVKLKPTSPGRRAVIRVVTPGLHKGAPFAAIISDVADYTSACDSARVRSAFDGALSAGARCR